MSTTLAENCEQSSENKRRKEKQMIEKNYFKKQIMKSYLSLRKEIEFWKINHDNIQKDLKAKTTENNQLLDELNCLKNEKTLNQNKIFKLIDIKINEFKVELISDIIPDVKQTAHKRTAQELDQLEATALTSIKANETVFPQMKLLSNTSKTSLISPQIDEQLSDVSYNEDTEPLPLLSPPFDEQNRSQTSIEANFSPILSESEFSSETSETINDLIIVRKKRKRDSINESSISNKKLKLITEIPVKTLCDDISNYDEREDEEDDEKDDEDNQYKQIVSEVYTEETEDDQVIDEIKKVMNNSKLMNSNIELVEEENSADNESNESSNEEEEEEEEEEAAVKTEIIEKCDNQSKVNEKNPEETEIEIIELSESDESNCSTLQRSKVSLRDWIIHQTKSEEPEDQRIKVEETQDNNSDHNQEKYIEVVDVSDSEEGEDNHRSIDDSIMIEKPSVLDDDLLQPGRTSAILCSIKLANKIVVSHKENQFLKMSPKFILKKSPKTSSKKNSFRNKLRSKIR